MVAKACLASRQRVSRLRAPPGAVFNSSNESRIVRDAGHDGHVFKVLGGGAHHRRAADVDVFNQMAKGNAGLRGRLLKGVEIDHHHVDGLDAMRGHGGLVLGVAANVKQPAMHLGMQGLHAPVQHLREAGQFADVLDRRDPPHAVPRPFRRSRPVPRQSPPRPGQTPPGRSCPLRSATPAESVFPRSNPAP